MLINAHKLQGVPKKSVNKEISITFEQMATQRCVRSQIGGIFGCWTLLNNCQEYSMCPSCVYTCLNICNPCTIFISSKVMLISLFTLFFGTPCSKWPVMTGHIGGCCCRMCQLFCVIFDTFVRYCIILAVYLFSKEL